MAQNEDLSLASTGRLVADALAVLIESDQSDDSEVGNADQLQLNLRIVLFYTVPKFPSV